MPEPTVVAELAGADAFGGSGPLAETTPVAWLEAAAARSPQAAAVLSADGAVTFAELQAQVGRLAAGLAGLGIARGEVVAIQAPNSLEFMLAWLAIAQCGAVLQTVHMPYGASEVEELLAHSGAVAVMVCGRAKDRRPPAEIEAARGRLPRLRDVIVLGETHGAGTHLAFADLLRSPGVPPHGCVAAASDAVQLYTSGTTSSPKAVRLTHGQLLGNARSVAGMLGLSPEDRILCAPPFTHLFGLCVLEMGLCAGAAACLFPAFTPQELSSALLAYRPTVLIAGPAHIAAALQASALTQDHVAGVRTAVLSGTTIPPMLAAGLETTMPLGRVIQLWGMTELQVGTCTPPDAPAEVRFGTIGAAVPGVELRVSDAGGEALPAGVVGELQARGASVFSGYVDNPGATAESFTLDGWFLTGDLARRDDAGNFTLAGRTKDLINRGGIKFNPLDVEVLIAGHPAVASCAIAPVPDPVLGERACCFVTLEPGAALDLLTLRDFLAEHGVAKLKWPERLEVVADMPMTPTRKIMKAVLVRDLLQAEAG